MAVIGIDLGTSYCATSCKIDDEIEIIQLQGFPTLPSVVSVQASGKIAIGRTAKKNQAKNPQDTVVEVKRKMGIDAKVRLGKKEMLPQEISALILSEIKEQVENEIGEKVTGAVITCPAYFKEPQRNATKEAGQLAGLNVLRIINEPTAAAYAYGIANQEQDKQDKENLFLVYDLGGGTFDVTVVSMVSGNLEVIGTGGDPELGGGNFDDRIVDWMIEHLEKVDGYAATLTDERRNALRMRLKSYAEEAKIKLCGPPETTEYQFHLPAVDKLDGKPVPFHETLTMEIFEFLISDLITNSMKWINEAIKVPKEELHYTEANLTEILLVGGSTRVPLIKKVLIEHFKDTPVRGIESGINPDEIVAMGAGILASELDPDSDDVSDNSITDVTGHTLSVTVFDSNDNKEHLHPLVPKESAIPTSASHTFASSGNFSPQAKIRIYQGEGTELDPEKVTMVGEFLIEIDPIKESTPLEIGLDLDENAILIAHATNQLTEQQVKCELNYEGSTTMPTADVERRQKEFEAQKTENIGTTHNPLDGKEPQTAPTNTAPTPPQPETPPQTIPPAAPPTEDARSAMNPIIRALYDKAMANFDSIPKNKQMDAMRLVGDIETASKNRNNVAGMTHYKALKQLFEGIEPNQTITPHTIMDRVHFSVTSPSIMEPCGNYIIDVWAHLEQQRKIVIERAREEANSTDIRIKSKGPVKIERGTILSVRLAIQDVAVNPNEDKFVWEGEIGNAIFAVSIDSTIKEGPKTGFAYIYANGFQIALVSFIIQVGTGSHRQKPLPVKERMFNTAFISYASIDENDVLARIQGLRKPMPGLDIFFARKDINSGEKWQERLEHEIATRDIMYLFWSEAASKSKYVNWEWRRGLETRGIDFIDPFPLVSPEVIPPPKEIADTLHFGDWELAFLRTPPQR